MHADAVQRALVALSAALAVLCPAGPAWAQAAPPVAGATTVYRCPGPPVLYTDSLSAQEARDRGCRTIDGAPITIMQAPRPRQNAAPAASAQPANRIDPAAQRARDNDARRILADELRREEERLAALQKEFNNGEPERRGDERNFQRYLDRVADMKAGIERKESDIAAIRRELTKLSP